MTERERAELVRLARDVVEADRKRREMLAQRYTGRAVSRAVIIAAEDDTRCAVNALAAALPAREEPTT